MDDLLPGNNAMSRNPVRADFHSGGFSHAAEILDFPAVLELIASKCVNEGARNLVRDLRAMTGSDRIQERLREIEEVREFQSARGRLPIASTDSRDWIERALNKHEVVSPEGCQVVAAVEESALEFQRMMDGEERFPALRYTISRIIPHHDLVEAIRSAIDRDAKIKDGASPQLGTIRKNIRKVRTDLRRYVDQLAKSYGSTDYATFTGSRHVLLVPRDKCRKKEGIVHATSHSGGSLYFEPFTLVEKNNAIETLIHDGRAEEARILGELTALIVEHGRELLDNIRLWEILDVSNAKALFSSEFACTSPTVSDGRIVRLVAARHPLLDVSLRQEPGDRSVVPLDLILDSDSPVLVITGPNAGGKTVSLKMLGLAVLMFQSGLPVPCGEGTRLPIFHAVIADIGDEQSIATSLSTFTSHLRHLDVMCRTADGDSLCLIDEIGDGTDPDEGAALAIATLQRLQARGAFVVATTHFGKVKSYALRTDGVSNASMAFDDENDKPLYKLFQGTAGRSRGIETARRLGFDPAVVRDAESLVGEETYKLENVLCRLESSQLSLERERDALRAQSDALNQLIASYNEKEQAMVEFKEAYREKIREEIEEMLLRTRKEIEGLVKRIRETEAEKSVVREAHESIKRNLDKVHERPKPKRAGRVAPGDVVSLSPSGHPRGRVIDVEKDAATVEINGKKLSIKRWNLYKIEEAREEKSAIEIPVRVAAEPLHTTVIDVRGRDREEALEAVDQFLDRAVLSGVQEIKIIHGVGEGVLLQAIRDLLKSDSRVGSSRQGMQGEGGVGVTFVSLD